MNSLPDPESCRRIYIVGFMGCGKTTLGQQWASRFNKHFIDLDEALETRLGMTMQGIFATRGEAWFRIQERKILLETIDNNGFIATGGGVIESPENREFLILQPTVFIDMPWDILWERIVDSERPLVKALGYEELYDQYLYRRPLYIECASYVITSADTAPCFE